MSQKALSTILLCVAVLLVTGGQLCLKEAVTRHPFERPLDFFTIIFSVWGLLGIAILPVFALLAWTILEQDRRLLRRQGENLRRFDGERYSSTELDLLGPEITRMLRDAQRDGAPTEIQSERTITFLA